MPRFFGLFRPINLNYGNREQELSIFSEVIPYLVILADLLIFFKTKKSTGCATHPSV